MEEYIPGTSIEINSFPTATVKLSSPIKVGIPETGNSVRCMGRGSSSGLTALLMRETINITKRMGMVDLCSHLVIIMRDISKMVCSMARACSSTKIPSKFKWEFGRMANFLVIYLDKHIFSQLCIYKVNIVLSYKKEN